MSLDDISAIDVNEAFAPQLLAVQNELGLGINKLNVNGGAIALGHSVGASGDRITVNLVHELIRTGSKYAVVKEFQSFREHQKVLILVKTQLIKLFN